MSFLENVYSLLLLGITSHPLCLSSSSLNNVYLFMMTCPWCCEILGGRDQNFFYKLSVLLFHWVFVAACRLSLVVAGRVYSRLQFTGFSLWWLLLRSRALGLQQLQLMGLVAPWPVGSCQIRDWTCVPALAGRFLTTGPPGKPWRS